jgi:hypothetical protein
MSSLQDLCSGCLMGYIPSWERHDYELEKIQDARVNAKHALSMVRYCRTETGEEARRAEAVWLWRARSWRKFANALACRRKTSKEERGEA